MLFIVLYFPIIYFIPAYKIQKLLEVQVVVATATLLGIMAWAVHVSLHPISSHTLANNPTGEWRKSRKSSPTNSQAHKGRSRLQSDARNHICRWNLYRRDRQSVGLDTLWPFSSYFDASNRHSRHYCHSHSASRRYLHVCIGRTVWRGPMEPIDHDSICASTELHCHLPSR